MKHKMEYNPEEQVFYCPTCGRTVKLDPFEIVVKGNQQVDHTVMHGMEIDIQAEQTTLDPDVWEW